MRRLLAICVAAAVCGSAPAQTPCTPSFGTNEARHLALALDHLGMTPADTEFDKDVGEPLWALGRVRRLLAHPLETPALADEALAATDGGAATSAWPLIAGWLETALPAVTSAPPSVAAPGAPPELAGPLADFLQSAHAASGLLARAFARLDDSERRYLAASALTGLYDARDDTNSRAELIRFGLPDALLREILAQEDALDPEPDARRRLALLERIDYGALLAAGRLCHAAAQRLAGAATGVAAWPERPLDLATPLGPVRIGSAGPDAHSSGALLVLDPGGDDTYAGDAGAADGLHGRPLACIVDLGGRDRYAADGLLGAAAALFGAGGVLDAGGDDVYAAAFAGQAAGLFGAAWLEDRGGDDVYRARALAQGAAFAGAGLLADAGGRDLYALGSEGQAFAGVRAVGLLIDEAGDDRYLAGGRKRDHERYEERYVSLAQGFAIGARPYAGGGVAALVDRAGNDVYAADIFGQGASYWYSAGVLADAAGEDTYTLFHYGQGAGIHLSVGLLVDGGGGRDRYDGHALVQGCAHDFAAGLLLDRGGYDTYTADHFAQGRGMNQGFGLLVDSGGNDSYLARERDSCQAIGDTGGPRECGSLAVLLDLGGTDRYSCGAADGARAARPDFGILYDFKP